MRVPLGVAVSTSRMEAKVTVLRACGQLATGASTVALRRGSASEVTCGEDRKRVSWAQAWLAGGVARLPGAAQP